MKPTEELKNKLEAAQSKEEAYEILTETKSCLEQSGIIPDEELEQVAGGGYWDAIKEAGKYAWKGIIAEK